MPLSLDDLDGGRSGVCHARDALHGQAEALTMQVAGYDKVKPVDASVPQT
jgi:hypothetical protein